MSVPLSKFAAPVVPGRAVFRPRLMETLQEDGWRVAVVTGGPATGKTLCLAQWFDTLGPLHREWVALDAQDDRPQRFWLLVANALERTVPGAFSETVEAVSVARSVMTDALDRLIIDWSGVADPVVLVIDDVHHLRTQEIMDDLAFVIEQLPEGSRIALAGRADPPLPIARWRSRSWLTEIRQRDLAFTIPETAELLRSLGESRVSPIETAELWLHSEGWVAGLRLGIAELKESSDIATTLEHFSGRSPMVADLLADELLRRSPHDIAEFLLRTSVVDALDAQICDALSGRNDTGELLRKMEADLQFVTATGPRRDSYRYHPLLLEMLRHELQVTRPEEVQSLNRLAAAILEGRGEIAQAVGCLLAAGDIDRAFDLVFAAAYRRADLCDTSGILTLVSLFPRELVTESASRMLTYALMLGLADHMEEGQSWLERAFVRLTSDDGASARDLAVLDGLRLLSFAVGGGEGEAVGAGRRALDAIEGGLDLGVVGFRTRMNLVRAYLIVDKPRMAESVLHGGDPGDEIAALVLAPALAARIALRDGRLSEVETHAHAALRAARAFGIESHMGTLDAHLSLAGALVERNDLPAATTTLERLDEINEANPEAHVYQVLVQLEKARVSAALGDVDALFATFREAHKAVALLSQSALATMIDIAAARWYIEFGEVSEAEELIVGIPDDASASVLLNGRLDLAHRRFDTLKLRLEVATFESMRDALIAELLLARAGIESGGDAEEHMARAIGLAAPEGLVRVFLEEGTPVVRMARSIAESVGTESASSLALALGAPPRSRATTNQSTAILSEREASVLRFLPTRLSNAEIATECFMSVNTVKTHLKGIYAKLGATSRVQAVERAHLLGLL